MWTLHSVFGHAARLDVIDTNLAQGVRRLASKQRARRLDAAELFPFGEAMRTAAERGEHPVWPAAVELIALTGFP